MDHPIITIFCAFTRRWAVERWIEDLSKVEHNPANTNLAFIVDTDEPFIRVRLQRMADEKGYRKCEIVVNSNHQPNEVRVAARRQRIADMKNQSKKLIRQMDGDYVIGLEDDTVFGHLKCFCRIMKPLVEDARVGFVEGVQCGRWGVKMIGAWHADDFEYPQRMWTAMPQDKKGYEQIDAGGFYFYATRKELYLNHEYYSSSDQPWGPDVNYGLWLRNRGYQCIIDWDTVLPHNDHNVLLTPDNDVTKITFSKNITGEWLRTDEVAS